MHAAYNALHHKTTGLCAVGNTHSELGVLCIIAEEMLRRGV